MLKIAHPVCVCVCVCACVWVRVFVCMSVHVEYMTYETKKSNEVEIMHCTICDLSRTQIVDKKHASIGQKGYAYVKRSKLICML